MDEQPLLEEVLEDIPCGQPDPAHGADERKTSPGQKLAVNKNAYNRFNFQMRKAADPRLQQLWKKRDLMTTEQVKEFMEMVVEQKGKVEETFLAQFEHVLSVEIDAIKGGWVAWAEAVTKEGEEQLRWMVTNNTIESRRHPSIPEGSPIPWPLYLQVKLIKETWSKSKEKRQGQTMTQEHKGEGIIEKFEEKKNLFQKDTLKLENMRPATWSSQTVCEEERGDSEVAKRNKLLIMQIRKAHSAWGRCQRTLQSALTRSAQHCNTNNCKFQHDLEQHLMDGKALDTALLEIEHRFESTSTLPNQDIATAASMSNKVNDLIKKSNKTTTILEQMQKV